MGNYAPCRSETTETKIGLNDYVINPYNLVTFYGNRCRPNRMGSVPHIAEI